MRAINWLKRLRQSERGNALVIGALSMPLLLGGAAFAVDTIQFTLFKRQLQRAADSTAVAAAYAMTQDKDAHTAGHRDLDENYFPTLAEAESITPGAFLGFDQAVQVRLRAERSLPFMSIFTKAATNITAEATAAVIQSGRFCVLSLYDGTEPGIDVNGNADLNLGCGMATNSRATEAVTAGGSSTVTASPILSAGGLKGAGNNFKAGTVLQPYAATQSDPFADVPDPVLPSDCSATVDVGPNDPAITIQSGCYSSVSIKGGATIADGAVIMVKNGDIGFGSQANVTGTNVTFILTGDNGNAGKVDWNGQATLNLTAPTTGDYAEILFYRDRRAPNVEQKINGGASAVLRGAFYFPSSDIEFTGNAGFQTSCLQMVGQIIRFRGTAEINNTCSLGGNLGGFELKYVKLVG